MKAPVPPRKYKPDELPCVQQAKLGNADWWTSWPGSQKSERAKDLCHDCPLFLQCREVALEDGIPCGVWGGMDEGDRARYWAANGGRPTKFDEVMDSQIGPLLQERRDREHAA